MTQLNYSIGEFARITGLSEKALRIYDSRGLLLPAEVDENTGYRRYSDERVDEARLIAMLRAINMSLDDIEGVLAAPRADRSALVGRYWYRESLANTDKGFEFYKDSTKKGNTA